MSHKIRRPLHDGMQLVHALWFDLALLGEAEVRRRVLRHWAPGARLHRVHDGFLLLLATPRYGQCAALDGLPLCEQAGILSSAPLAADERAVTPPSGIWLVRAAQAQLISLAAAPRIDPAAWLDLRAIPLHAPLRPPPAAAAAATAALLETLPVRDIFAGALAPPSDKREAFLRQMDKAQHGAKAMRRGAGIALAVTGVAAVLLGAIPLGLIKLFGGGKQAASAQADSGRQQRPPSALQQRLAALATRLAITTRASTVIGWRQAAYLRKMMQLLEQGDMKEALRHAIPLDTLSPARRPAFGTPRPRTSLEISGPGQASSSISLGGELEQYLRATYRATFERLDREGKIDEATYVLAELLKCGSEAVDYLEKKGRIKQAAQLAETMELAPEVAVRLWCMAGDVERAVKLARLGQAFAAAVQLLERRKSPQAPEMRLLWAEDLAMRGQLSEAAEAIWPLPEQQDKALAWLLEGERTGGVLGMRALLKKLALLPASLADSEAAVLQLLDDDSDEGAQQRMRLGTELLALSLHSPATRRVAAELMHPLLADRMGERIAFDKKAMTKLLSLSDGAVLRADLSALTLPAMVPPQELRKRRKPLRVHLAERGLLTIHDARRLPDGHYLLALGEGGVVRIDRHGRQLAQFPVPATRLVMAAGGQRALALVQRDNMWRVSRIDLIARKVSDWIIQPLRFWADNYDGLIWNAVIDNRLVAIDSSKDQLAVSWQVADLPGRVVAFQEEPGVQTLLLATAEGIQQWRYQLPARRLLQRDSFPHPRDPVLALLPHSARDAPTLVCIMGDDGPRYLQVHHGGATAPLTLPLQAIASVPEVTQAAGLLMVRSHLDDDSPMECLVADGGTGTVLAQLRLDECDAARVHVNDGHILLCDDAGRLIDIDCENSQVHTLTLA
ncbi:bpX6 domain-containing protein [Janthinobacterium sp. SUN098]|uniref:bpX6 domain-containing protein n=1 Tax=Janthinobacterium sp. SUN098 TaxID=3002437 RepID=UPI0038D50C5A